jgi:hypothetical protein
VQSVVPKREDKPGEPPGKSYNTLGPESSLGGVVDTPWLLQQQNNGNRLSPLSREKREELDRKQNWIYNTPDSQAYSAKKMLGVRDEKKNALGEEKEFKSAMQSYLERGEKKGDAENDEGSKTNSNSGGTRGERPDRDDPRDSGDDRNRTAGGANEAGRSGRGQPGDAQRSPSLLEPGSATSLFHVPGEYPSGASLYGDKSRFGVLPSLGTRVEKTEAQKAWATEFKQLLDSGGGGGSSASASSFGRGNDPVNWLNDATRQPINPVLGAGPGSLPGSGFSRNPFDAARAPTFPSATRPTGFADSSPQFFGNSSLSPAVMAPPPAMLPKPGVLELPKRKF